MECDPVPSSSESTVQGSIIITKDLFREMFETSNCHAWITIAKDPIYLLPNSKFGKQIVGFASLMSGDDVRVNCASLVDALCHVFENRLFLSQSDFVSFMKELHLIRTNSELEDVFAKFFESYVHSSGIENVHLLIVSRVMYQVWLRRISEGMLFAIKELYSKEVSQSELSLPDGIDSTDQNVLYYICGYMVQKLVMASAKHKKLENVDVLAGLFSSKTPIRDNHFVKQYQVWTEKLNRGGLRFAIPDFFMLVREFDTIYRKHCQATAVTGCNKSEMLSLIFDGLMVKYYWTKLFEKSDIDELKSLAVLDYLINLFITVKGFAVSY